MYSKRDLSLIVILTVFFTLLVEVYMVLLENSSFFYQMSNWDVFINIFPLFSFKQLLLFAFTFLILFLILFNNDLKIKVFNFVYNYRFLLGGVIFIVCVIFEIHGSSLSQLNISSLPHNSIFGLSHAIRGDEFSVSTPFAFSQYYNNFGYFSDIVRATSTDMFFLYGQPVFDIAVIFRPFHWGYLFLSQGKGLSFYWMGRLIALFLVSFEFGMLITNKNKVLSLAYTLLITFSPLVQWWFAVNGLVECLIAGQLSILLINHYMTTNNYYKRLLDVILLVICGMAFILAVYPAWQIPLAYIFLGLVIWIILKNKSSFKHSKKDILLVLTFIGLFSLSIAYVFLKSYDEIIILMNTVYPGNRTWYGGEESYWRSGDFTFLFDYMRVVFFPLTPDEGKIRISLAYVVSFFPTWIHIIFYCSVYPKKERFTLTYSNGNLHILFSLLFIHFPKFCC